MIHLEHIFKKIGQKHILHDFSLNIEQGELVAIVGKSGSGKTTLLNIIGLLDGEYEGDYLLFGHSNVPVNTRTSQKIIREQISYLFQNFALIENESVKYNLLMALKYTRLSKKEKEESIKNILDKIGLASTLKQKISELSGGEQQRIAIARALLKPSILADEPTGSLDQENRDLILQFLIEMNNSGKTVIIVTHDPYIADKCQRIVRL
ncbi:TPA: ABC transporter ATP-binding protein [Streptococcus suis]|nr:ABC transporter ATP-binding protein [Streptococcus suis]NQQ26546.1 ABC transporter ATP-binding protein [Streptococcus suis]HEL2035657.1 ABC transporter ATP-binding protein [Streptococcus suis]HEM5540712.1 ABC transporter ATP-binding protein [Streptococcus suis]HEM6503016.1 ABC transporter ATP-binding protein [Streptococcus suis]